MIYISELLHELGSDRVINIQIDTQNSIELSLGIQNLYILDFDLDIKYDFRFRYE